MVLPLILGFFRENCFQEISNIWYSLSDNALQDRLKSLKLVVSHVRIPTQNLNAIVWLKFKVVTYIVNNKCFFEISTKLAQVLEIHPTLVQTTITVQSEIDELMLGIHLVKNEVSIFLQTCCENHNLKAFLHFLKKLNGKWSLTEYSRTLIKMD
jgi:hypothetical protein